MSEDLKEDQSNNEYFILHADGIWRCRSCNRTAEDTQKYGHTRKCESRKK